MDENNKLFPNRLNFMVNDEMFNELNLIRKELDYKNMSVVLRKIINEGLWARKAENFPYVTDELGDHYMTWTQKALMIKPINITISERDKGLKQFNKEHKEE